MARLSRAPARLHAVPMRVARAPKQALPFYQSAEWKALVSARKGDRDWHAARARGKPGERLILDHIHEIRDGGARLDPKNTQWLTMSEHQAKTAKAKRARAGL
jgi:hypothetical protein